MNKVHIGHQSRYLTALKSHLVASSKSETRLLGFSFRSLSTHPGISSSTPTFIILLSENKRLRSIWLVVIAEDRHRQLPLVRGSETCWFSRISYLGIPKVTSSSCESGDHLWILSSVEEWSWDIFIPLSEFGEGRLPSWKAALWYWCSTVFDFESWRWHLPFFTSPSNFLP